MKMFLFFFSIFWLINRFRNILRELRRKMNHDVSMLGVHCACLCACVSRLLSSYSLITFATSWRPLSGQVATGLLGGVHTLTVGGMREVKCKYEWSGHTGCYCQSWECALLLSQLHCIHCTYIHTYPLSLSHTYQCIFPRRKLLFTFIFFRFFAQLLSYLCVRVVSVELCTQKPHIHKYTHIRVGDSDTNT